MTGNCPILGICGHSGCGKTTLLEQLIPHLAAKGLRVAAVKHDAHGLDVDRPGKDSDRLFQAGADVLLQGPDEELFRGHVDNGGELTPALALFAGRCDVILVEGHKRTALPKLWVLNDDETAPPDDVTNIKGIFAKDAGRFAAVAAAAEEIIHAQWSAMPVYGCVLIGGKSARMGRPKHLLQDNGR
ncbi:MAG: molybdopterin-guanine dinucleotide biosynthesis protein B, partial [Planctomycetota bacterium]